MKPWQRFTAAALLFLVATGAIIKSGASTDTWTVDATSKAGRTTNYDASGRELSFQSKITYSATSGAFTPPATPTDMACIFGSATKTVRVISCVVSANQTTAGINMFYLVKRSSANTGGTAAAMTMVPMDANNAAATATLVQSYTVNPTTGGVVGNVRAERILCPAATSISPGAYDMLGFEQNTLLDQPVTLRGVAQGLCLNFNGAGLPAGLSMAVEWVWIEE